MIDNEPEKLTSLELPAVNQGEGVVAEENVVKSLGTERNPELLASGTVQNLPVNNQQTISSSAKPTLTQDDNSYSPTTLVGSSPQIADDIDLIEKEWVEKAKEIVNKTKQNPYLQNKAKSEFKADYIKKRYNKDVVKSDK